MSEKSIGLQVNLQCKSFNANAGPSLDLPQMNMSGGSTSSCSNQDDVNDTSSIVKTDLDSKTETFDMTEQPG